jgi:hypothetical protein
VVTKIERTRIGGNITLVHKDKKGKVIEKREVKNIVTAAGKAVVAGLINDSDSQDAFTALALGIGSAAATTADTGLGSEITSGGFERAEATVSRVTTDDADDTSQLVHEFTSTSSGATVAVTECGAFNAMGTGVTMLGRQVFAAVNMAEGDKLEVTYKFDVD